MLASSHYACCLTSSHGAKKFSETMNKHKNTVEYNAESFLFISLKEKLDLTLFSVRKSQYFITRTKPLIFNGRL